MSQPLYERYKDALRRGHVAAERGQLEGALEAYGEAARLAPERALPLVGIAAVLGRLGKASEALAAFDAALERAATDEAALRGRARLLEAAGRAAEAARTLDRLVAALDGADRVLDALDVAGHALALAESRSRRATVATLIARAATDATAAADPDRDAAIERARAGLRDRVAASGADEEVLPTDPPPGAADPGPPVPAFDPVAATIAVEDGVRSGDRAATRELALAAAHGHRAGGRLSAAVDACYLALADHPADVELHLTLAELYLDLGWRGHAVEKLELIGRLVDLTDDRAERDRVCAVVRDRLPDESALAARCA